MCIAQMLNPLAACLHLLMLYLSVEFLHKDQPLSIVFCLVGKSVLKSFDSGKGVYYESSTSVLEYYIQKGSISVPPNELFTRIASLYGLYGKQMIGPSYVVLNMHYIHELAGIFFEQCMGASDSRLCCYNLQVYPTRDPSMFSFSFVQRHKKKMLTSCFWQQKKPKLLSVLCPLKSFYKQVYCNAPCLNQMDFRCMLPISLDLTIFMIRGRYHLHTSDFH